MSPKNKHSIETMPGDGRGAQSSAVNLSAGINKLMLIAIVSVMVLWCASKFVGPPSPDTIIRVKLSSAPLVQPENLGTYFNKDIMVRVELYTGDGCAGKDGNTYAFERLIGKQWQQTPRSRSKWINKHKILVDEITPDRLTLYSQDHTPVLSINSSAVDLVYLKPTFQGQSNDREKADVPAAWLDCFDRADDFSIYTLPQKSKVTVMGLVRGGPGNYTLAGSSFQADGSERGLGPIVSTMPLETMLKALH